MRERDVQRDKDLERAKEMFGEKFAEATLEYPGARKASFAAFMKIVRNAGGERS